MQPLPSARPPWSDDALLRTRTAALLLGWGWAAAIVWLSLTPTPPRADFVASDKLGHLAAYALLMFWFCRLHVSPRTRLAHGLAFLAMGVGLEVLQGASGLREYEVADMAANAAGVLLGWLAARLFALRRKP